MRSLVCSLVLVVACTSAPQAPTSVTVTQPQPTTTTSVPSTVPCVGGPPPFQSDGQAGSSPDRASDATILFGVEWETHPECERVVLTLSTEEGAPAVRATSFTSSLLRPSGVLRVVLSDEVRTSNLADQLIGAELVRRVVVVRSLSGPLFVDLHLGQPAFARVQSRDGPGRILIDLRPGGTPYVRSPLTSESLVVVEPAADTVSYPFSITGYVLGDDREVVEASVTSLADGSSVRVDGALPTEDDVWRSFSILVPEGPTGRLTVDVDGELSFPLVAG
ncbi:MAG: hypothetical protein KatS3mg011_1316 [Acidimicrobiia bacterium]|nr:MAG: hypothetical protein KatS3mg011_1316 [Acidimicrobiia bacterium]